ncbi:hypothetical protein M413DRAFT_31269 [Hebeloma cylindrosporum]|uniref:Uncharacterized protein n=1 Tax=Hebeloma cylindrosporum TaxID=76867 RepID=A0A0C3BXS4_HEBCY|nr:hypothetical protein M413DRAFT_31269 [Hebeloma cylindrosporum h7]
MPASMVAVVIPANSGFLVGTHPEPKEIRDYLAIADWGNPRNFRMGGFVLTGETTEKWATHLRTLQPAEDPTPVSANSIQICLQPSDHTTNRKINWVIKRFGISIMFVGEGLTEFRMVPTQKARFKGRVGMPSSEIPQFVEGEREAAVRNILIELGLSAEDFKFETWLCGSSGGLLLLT